MQELFSEHAKTQKKEIEGTKKVKESQPGKYQPNSLHQLKGLPGVKITKRR